MTRVNLIPVEELKVQHLVAEYRELPQIYGKALRAQQRGETRASIAKRAPKEFMFGPGSILFFYDKILWLNKRYALLVAEMHARGYHTTYPEPPWHKIEQLDDEWKNDWEPSEAEIARSRERIDDRLANPIAYQNKQGRQSTTTANDGKHEWDFV